MSKEEQTQINGFVLLGRKVGMTQVFDDNNNLIPVTVVQAGPCPVLQLKTDAKDGYTAIQIGFEAQKPQRLNKPQLGHFKKAGVDPVREISEFRTFDVESVKVGDIFTVGQFSEGQMVDVIGTTKGKGFQGVVKRHKFSGGPASHGSMTHRRGGSYGMCQWPGRVYKGRKMPGHMGNKRRTTQNLQIVKIIEGENLILVKGSVPGANGSLVHIRKAKKAKMAANA